MPQLEVANFAPQLVWLTITFVVLLLLMWRVTLPRVESVFTARQDRIADNLQKAEGLKAEAESALAGYQKAIADARAAAQAEHARAAAAIAAESAKREAVFGEKIAEQEATAERGITAAKTAAMAQVKPIATELAQSIAEKLIGARPGGDVAAAAVESAVKERA